MTNHNRIR